MQGMILANRYLLAEPVGRGGMGVVYRATDLRTGGPVAVKLLHPVLAQSEEFGRRLRREAELAASLTSPRVVRIIDLDADGEIPFLVMEFVPGPTLGETLGESGRLSPEEALRITIEVARALVAAHAAGIVHRDLKPDNIKLVDGQVKVLDFGIARAAGGGPTITGDFLGTPEYSAPEQAGGYTDIRTDIYALGVLLFRLIEGDLPFTGPTPIAVIQQQATAPVPAMHFAPPQVAVVVRRCLEKRPEDRYQTPGELLAALQAAQAAAGSYAPAPVVGATGTPVSPASDGAPAGRSSPSAAPTAPGRGARKAGVVSASVAALGAEASSGRLRRGRRGRLALAVGVMLVAAIAIAGVLRLGLGRGDGGGDLGTVEAATSPPDGGPLWFLAGSAQTDPRGGAWRFKQTVPRDLIAEGFVRTKLTGSDCAQPADQAVAYEGTVDPDKTGHDLWEVIVRPSRRAEEDPKLRSSGAAFLRQQPDGRTNVEIALDGLPPRLTLNVCFRQQ